MSSCPFRVRGREASGLWRTYLFNYKQVNMIKCVWRFIQRRKQQAILSVIAMSAFATNLWAQTADGNAGITEATTQVKGYFDTGCNLMYAIGAVSGIIGAVKVY